MDVAHSMVTPWHANVFRITGLLGGGPNGQWWIPHTIMQTFDISLLVGWKSCRTKSGVAHDFRHHDDHVNGLVQDCSISNATHWRYCSLALTHCGLMTPYGDGDLGQHWLRLWLVAWRHQAITWTNVDLPSVRSIGIHLSTILQEILQPSITKISWKITFWKFLWNLPGTNELSHQGDVSVMDGMLGSNEPHWAAARKTMTLS